MPKPLVDPTEQTAAVLTGWAIAWVLIQLTLPATPAILVGGLVWAFQHGKYRRRWLDAGGRPEPGA